MYSPLIPAQTEQLPIRGVSYHVNCWGQGLDHNAPLLVLAHGWGDVGASYQFVIDALGADWVAQRQIIAPDWRGFGRSEAPQSVDSYLFADYFADLEVLLAHYAEDARPIDLVGHSMGGNVAMLYAGIRPERIRKLVNLEGFGLPDGSPAQAPSRLRNWLDQTAQARAGKLAVRPYASRQAVAERLIKTNPRLSQDKALWLAGVWAKELENGQWQVLVDAGHKVSSPLVYRAEETLALYREITADVLAIEATDCSLSQFWEGTYTVAQYHERLQNVAHHTIRTVDNASHNIHHDQPEILAEWMREFLAY